MELSRCSAIDGLESNYLLNNLQDEKKMYPR